MARAYRPDRAASVPEQDYLTSKTISRVSFLSAPWEKGLHQLNRAELPQDLGVRRRRFVSAPTSTRLADFCAHLDNQPHSLPLRSRRMEHWRKRLGDSHPWSGRRPIDLRN